MNTIQGIKENKVAALANVCLKSCQRLASQIEETKQQLLRDLRGSFEVPEKMFRLALTEAEALAWETSYPQLVFPDLAVEKVQAAAAWHRQQAEMQRHSLAELRA